MYRFIRLFAAILALLMTTPVFASNADFDDDYYEDEAHFGVRATLDFDRSFGVSDLVKWGPGASVGVVYYAPFGRITYFNAGVLFSYTTFKLDGEGGTKYSPYIIKGHLRTPSLKVPLDFGVKFVDNRRMRLSVYTGPHLYFNFDLRAKYDLTRSHSTYPVNEKVTNSGMDLDWGLGVAADLGRHWHAHFEGVVGLSHFGTSNEFIPGTPCAFRRAELSLGLGYNF